MNLKIDKQFVYTLAIVLAVVFSLFLLNYFFGISANSLTVKLP